MTGTRPPGKKTGRITPGCFAAPLLDCDGGPLSKEHYLSTALLRRFPASFTVGGLSWLVTPRRFSATAFQAKILCARHNNALSSLDAEAARLFDVMYRAEQGAEVGAHEFDGESLERWALKLLLGLHTSGNFYGQEGKEILVPDLHLRILFGEQSIPDGCGLYYIGDDVPRLDTDLLGALVNRYPAGDPEEGFIYGITIRLAWLRFITTVSARVSAQDLRLFHRPGGLQLGVPERGRIGLRWNPRSSLGLVVKMPDNRPISE